MKKNLFPVVFLTFVILMASCCISCKTTEPEVITEYVPTIVDIRPDIEMLFDARPNNEEQMQVIPKDLVTNSFLLLHNSWQYQLAWERWEDYAGTLELYLEGLANDLAGVEPEVEEQESEEI